MLCSCSYSLSQYVLPKHVFLFISFLFIFIDSRSKTIIDGFHYIVGAGKDALVKAKTGTGKSAAFLVHH